MSSDYARETRSLLLFSLFIMVVPLIFFPNDFGLQGDMSSSALSAFELGWYVVILFTLFSRLSVLWVILFALLTLVYRLLLGIGFALFLVAMFSLDLSFSFKLGTHHYLPAFLLQAIISPFALKSFFEILVRKPGRRQRMPGGPKETIPEKSLKAMETQIPRSGRDQIKVRPLAEEKKIGKTGQLEGALHYLREYSGVEGAVLVDNEGLVVAGDSLSHLEPETFASLALSLTESNDLLLDRIGEAGLKRMGIHTPNLWISLNRIESFTLITVADRNTDELLSVRISQVAAMIKKYFEQRYNQKVLKGVED